MDLDGTTLFPPGPDVLFIRPTKDPALERIIRYSERGGDYRRITYRRGKNRATYNVQTEPAHCGMNKNKQTIVSIRFLCSRVLGYGDSPPPPPV